MKSLKIGNQKPVCPPGYSPKKVDGNWTCVVDTSVRGQKARTSNIANTPGGGPGFGYGGGPSVGGGGGGGF